MPQDQLSQIRSYLNEVYKSSILENFLELQIVDIAKGKIIYSARTADKHCNMYGTIHGGTLASICDVAMGVACISMGKRVVTIDMNVSYIKNAQSGSTLTAIGEVVSNGKTIMRATGQIFNEQQQLLVRSQASYYVTGDFTPDITSTSKAG